MYCKYSKNQTKLNQTTPPPLPKKEPQKKVEKEKKVDSMKEVKKKVVDLSKIE